MNIAGAPCPPPVHCELRRQSAQKSIVPLLELRGSSLLRNVGIWTSLPKTIGLPGTVALVGCPVANIIFPPMKFV
jgi:hypothetical protein